MPCPSRPAPARTVGREAELEQLEARSTRCGRGARAAWRSRASRDRQDAAARRAAPARRGARLPRARGAAAEFERDLPFRRLGRRARRLRRLAGARAATAADDLARGARGRPSVAAPRRRRAESVADERYRAHRAVRRLLELLAAERPLVLVLDDLHWSDDASIELLARAAAARRRRAGPVRARVPPGPAPARAVARARGAARCARIALAPLNEAQATELLGDLEPRAAARRSTATAAATRSTSSSSRARGARRCRGAAAATAPCAACRAAVAASLARSWPSLSDGERALLEAAAVAGEPFEPDLAAAIAELPDADGPRGARRAARARPRAPDRGAAPLRLPPPARAPAVYESTPGGWRLAAHARAPRHSPRGGAAAERAHHVEQSATRATRRRSRCCSRRARPPRRARPAAAARWFEARCGCCRRRTRAPGRRARGARAALRSLGELERCRATLLEALELLPPDDVGAVSS